jgi:hypothetical protein
VLAGVSLTPYGSRKQVEMSEEELNETLKSLLLKGLITVSYDENLEARFAPTPLGIIVAEASQ